MSTPSDQAGALLGEAGLDVAVIGLAGHGAALAAHLHAHGHRVNVWDPAGTEGVQVPGCRPAVTPLAAARLAAVVVVSLPDVAAVRQALLAEDGVVHDVSAECVVVDTSPIGPREARSLWAELDRRGLRYVDAAVSGTARAASEGTLATHAGGDPETVELVRAVLEAWTAPGRLTCTGGPGTGVAARVVASTAGAAALQTVGELMRLGRDLGLDRSVTLDVLLGGPLGPVVAARERRLREEDDSSEVHERLDSTLEELSVALRYAGAALPAVEGAYLNARISTSEGAGDRDIVRIALQREGLAHLDDPDLQTSEG